MTGPNRWLHRVVSWHSSLSLARKLTFLGVLTSAISLVIAMTAVLAWDLSSARTRLVRDTGMLADVIGSNSTAAVAFGDAKAAGEIIRALSVNDSIVSAVIWTKDGSQLARFDRTGTRPVQRVLPPRAFDIRPPRRLWCEFTDGVLLLARPIVLDDDVIGTVVIESDLSVLWNQAATSGLVVALVLLGTFGLSVVLASRMQRTISSPLLRLTYVTRAVTRDRGYDVRVENAGERAGRNRRADRRLQRDARRDSAPRRRARAASGGARADGRGAHRGAARGERRPASRATRRWKRAAPRASSSPT